ncbi:hypothetical protein CBR_g4723 [Chara braunii]|uniref:Integrase catalytic domain-containing protein n=1 Tax=Chara braunii TaxID=69332 RepID=A0A388KIL5_CHABU|nr:hypothetical protein CBR_g4723 [Chara braunii]|eukprot:GBG69895.1 hypothetical protein CBR_g4723 [Chara braunii]
MKNQVKTSTSQESPRGGHEPGKRKEAVEVEDDDDEEEEDERLRREEDQRAEQRARKKGTRGEAEPIIHDGPPKKKKYAVRLEEGFDVEKVIDRLLEGHNDLMTLKEILASAPRLRDELKGRLSRRLVPNVHLGTILHKEAEWAESGTKMDWKCVACGTVDLMVKGSKCAAMVDTRAEMNIIREADAIRFGLDIDRSDCGILHGASCKAMKGRRWRIRPQLMDFWIRKKMFVFISTWSPRVPSCVGYPIWQAPKGYERRNELVFKPFEEEDPWGGKDVQWMMELALASSHSLMEDMRTIEEGPGQVERHEDLMGGMYLLVNTLLQEGLDQSGSLNWTGKVDEVPESQDDEFEEGEIKEAFRVEEYDGIYLELGLLLSCEMRLRDASERAQRMLQRYLVRDDHLFVRREVGKPRRVVCGRNRQIDVVAALHDGIAGGHRGVQATYAKISELYYWDGMMDMVGKFCRSCVPCQERSRLRQGEPLHPRLEREVGAIVHLDLLFMPLGDQGYNYIFDVRDNLSGFIDGRAIRTKTGLVLVSCIEEYYLRYPFVREFVMDRGSEFTCQEVQKLLSSSCPGAPRPGGASTCRATSGVMPTREGDGSRDPKEGRSPHEGKPAGETAEEKRARRTRRIDEIWQERQRLEATGELPEQQQERQRSGAAGALPGQPPSVPAKAPEIPEMWRDFWEQRGEELPSPVRAGFGVARKAEERLNRKIKFLAKTTFDRHLLLEGDLAGKKMKEASHGVRLEAMEMEIQELRALVVSQAAIIESLRQQTQGKVDRPESSRQGEQR